MSINHVTAVPAHPAWCDPRTCTTVPDGGYLLTVHRGVVHDDDHCSIEVMRSDVVALDGAPISSDPTTVVLDIGGCELTAEAAFALAKHLASAAAIAAGVAPLPVGGA